MQQTKMIPLTKLQRMWLVTRGNRNEYDIVTKDDGFYVPMGDGFGGYKLIKIPEDNYIDLYWHNEFIQSHGIV